MSAEPKRGRASSGRKPLPGFGMKGRLGSRGQLVRGVLERGLARILWTERGKRRSRSYADTVDGRASAVAYGKGVAKRLEKLAEGVPVAPTYRALTVHEMYEAYELAEFEHLRKGSKRNYGAHWRRFEAFFGADRLATDLTREYLDGFRKELRKGDIEVNQIGKNVEMVKRVYGWAEERDLIPPTKITRYKFKIGKDEKRLEVAEYTREEAEKILAQFDPRDPAQWRGYVAIVLFSVAGPRANAALHLEWRDIDFAAGTVRWRPELAKTGEEHVQPLPPAALEALWVAYGWRTARDYRGPFLFFGPGRGTRRFSRGRLVHAERTKESPTARKPDKPWTYQAFHWQLRKAEAAAGVPYIPYRGAHGFRRLVVGDVLAATSNLVLAGQYIGDRDLRTLRRSYVRTRPDELRRAADVFGSAAVQGPAAAAAAPAAPAAPAAAGSADVAAAGSARAPDPNRTQSAPEPDNDNAPRQGGALDDVVTDDALTTYRSDP